MLGVRVQEQITTIIVKVVENGIKIAYVELCC